MIRVRGVAFALVLGTAAAAQPPRTLTRRDRPEVTSVKIVGLNHLDAGALADGLVTHASHCKNLLLDPFCLVWKTPLFYEHDYLDRTELKRDVLRALIFLYRHGYHDAIVDTVLTPPAGLTVAVTFKVIEGPPTILTTVAIDTPPHLLSKKQLGPDVVPLRVGQPFDLSQLDSAITNIQSALWQRGYADAHVDTSTVVTPGDSGKPRVALRMKVVQGRINTIGGDSITGNQKVAKSVIRRSLGLHPGQIYQRGQNPNRQRTLYQSGMFRRAVITAKRDTSAPGRDSIRTVYVDVTEAPLHDFQGQFGFNTVEFVQVSGRFTTYNFLGGGRQLIVSGGLANLFAPALNGQLFFTDVIRQSGAGNFGLDTRPYLQPTWQIGVDLVQPWFLTTENSLGAGVFAHRRSAPGVYVDYGYGGNATFTRHVLDRGDISLRYQFEETRTDADQVYFCVNFGICDQPTLATFNERWQKLSPVTLGLNIDRSNNQFYPTGYPTSGYVIKTELQDASSFTESDWQYNRAVLDAAWYHALGFHHAVLALRAHAGWVRPQSTTGKALGETSDAELLNPRVRFYAGGANSVRGFGENLLGPRVLTIPPDSLRYKTVQFSPHITKLFVFCKPSIDIQSCPLNPAPIAFPEGNGKHGNAVLSDQEFTVRPLGGNQIIEGSVEYRFPLVGALGAATFVDGALVGAGTGNQLEPIHSSGAITPGIGIRYYSSVGAIRIDLGLDPITTEELVVLTQAGVGPTAHLVEVGGRRTYAPALTEAGFNGFFNRVTLHLSIGQAF
ncbi:MAG TPA: BamA/TamA family outer membrane protein [Gemmatimonadaceae bacterium]|nr:BamA/TamA family outer membrane protein [Gemmatimonadaceae bacterium]